MEMMSGSVSNDSFSQDPLSVHTSPSWNLYDNPCYTRSYSHRKVSKSFWDLTGCKAGMESDLGRAKSQTLGLRAELEIERKARRKAESACRKLVNEVCTERQGREELSGEYEELAKEMEITRLEMERMRLDFEEERKMMKLVEVIREERVHMKLSEAKLLYDLKYKKLLHSPASADKYESPENAVASIRSILDRSAVGRKISPTSSGYKCSGNIAIFASADAGNPHIKQGIKGFVEFPKVVRAMGSKNKLLGTRLESQKAQICILLKQKRPMSSNQRVPSQHPLSAR